MCKRGKKKIIYYIHKYICSPGDYTDEEMDGDLTEINFIKIFFIAIVEIFTTELGLNLSIGGLVAVENMRILVVHHSCYVGIIALGVPSSAIERIEENKIAGLSLYMRLPCTTDSRNRTPKRKDRFRADHCPVYRCATLFTIAGCVPLIYREPIVGRGSLLHPGRLHPGGGWRL